jgi:hypothetical protein
MEARLSAMVARKHFVREVFLILIFVAGIGLALSTVLHNATNAYSPFFPHSVSQALTYFVSHTLTQDSQSSMASAKKLPLKILVAPALAPVPPPPPQDELDMLLAKTANPNRTVIVTALNGAWAEPNTMIDLFLESFRVGEGTQDLLDNLLIVALDAKAYSRCLQIHQHCYSLKTRGVDFSAEKLFMSEDYLKMMWRRLGFLGEILKRGYSIVFSDTDIMWLRNPLGRLAEDADIQITCDKYNGNPFDVKNEANTGFMYVRSNERTISFYRYWYLSRRFFPGQKEQDVLNILKFRRQFAGRGLKFLFLETKHFGGFCQRSRDLDDVYTMHANCCKGLKAKLIDLRNALADWVEYRNPTINSSSSSLGGWTPANACLDSWWN